MFSGYRMVIDDPSKIELITDDMKKLMFNAAKNTINMQAALTKRNTLETTQKFTMRNTFTSRQIQFSQCKEENPTNFSQLESSVGATEKAPWMERQEHGGIHVNPNGGQLAIPTLEARGGSSKNLVQKKMYHTRIYPKLIKYDPRNGGSPSSALVKAAKKAYDTKGYLKYNKNIYKVINFYKNNDDIKFQLEMLYFRGITSTVTKETPWLQPASMQPAQDGQKIFNAQIKKLDR